MSVPHHSWTDTKTQCVKYDDLKIEDLPNRVSKNFIEELCYRIKNKSKIKALLYSPHFFLPEINAQWITMLKGPIKTMDFVDKERLHQKTEINFKELKETILDLLTKGERSH